MSVSTRSYLTAGAAAMLVGAMAIAPVQPSTPTPTTAAAVRLSAAVQPLVNQVDTAAAVLGQTAPAPAVQQPTAKAAAQADNSASNAIDAAYGVIRYWANYLSLELGPWLLGWIPFGYLISDQIYIWYPNFTLPVMDSFVYDFLDPVVNDFWNPTVWANGLTAIANTARIGLNTVVQQEVAYFWSLAWFPIPLPPLPPLPFAATRVPAAAAKSESTAEQTSTVKGSGTGHSARPQVAKQSSDTADATPDTTVVDATDGAATPSAVTPSAASKTTKAGADAASGKSGSAKAADGDTGKKRSTAGSARKHGPKADKAGSGD
ncbi:hypothetical protein [Mycobacterium sp. shizuoka-1]|uniref:hypothetical protein n=1 Tax=Mycobacterium sp. shizuoka-1 TaxID=2039281 RepID=UPI000C067DFB|nr:hypothetical protein [Mycobacterium sp. shizuoka-1]GAY15962.1 hypothetical protein MSZK_26880 [Mycobacterium sp. shizuoka-1]